jgi:hypothetical protein
MGGDVLFVRIKKKACVFATTGDKEIARPGKIWANDGLYFCETPLIAAKRLRSELHRRAALVA